MTQPEPGSPVSPGDVQEPLQEEPYPVAVGGPQAAVPGGHDSRRSSQAVHLQSRVVGQGQEATEGAVGPGLDEGVLLEGAARFLHLLGYPQLAQRGNPVGHLPKEVAVLPGLARVTCSYQQCAGARFIVLCVAHGTGGLKDSLYGPLPYFTAPVPAWGKAEGPVPNPWVVMAYDAQGGSWAAVKAVFEAPQGHSYPLSVFPSVFQVAVRPPRTSFPRCWSSSALPPGLAGLSVGSIPAVSPTPVPTRVLGSAGATAPPGCLAPGYGRPGGIASPRAAPPGPPG